MSRRRKRNRGGGQSSAKNNSNNNQQRNKKRRRSGNRRREGAGFWGNADKLPPAQPDVRITDDPDAVPRSLGVPPLTGHEKIAAHYLKAIYDRAVTTAGALAAAGGLIEPDELADELADDE